MGLISHLNFFNITHFRLAIVQTPVFMRENTVFGNRGNGKKAKT